MQNVVGVRFQEAGKIYYFSPEGFEDIEPGEYIVVETSRGVEISRVVIAPGQVVNAELSEPLKPILRMADGDDIERANVLRTRAQETIDMVRRVVRDRRLPMKVVSGAYNLDGSRFTVYFTSEGRVDFRDLLRDLSRDLDTQVQLRQVGPRDQAKAVDGYGRCGRRLCCSSWLISFPSISIKMAKEQNLPLNPSKISGQCGRLLCCLAYEDDTYKQLKAQLPRPGTAVSTPGGNAKVLAVNALRQTITLQMESFEIIEAPAAALALELGVVRLLPPPDDDEMPSPPAPPPHSPGRRPVPPPAPVGRAPMPRPPTPPPFHPAGRRPAPESASPARPAPPRPAPAPAPPPAEPPVPRTLERPAGAVSPSPDADRAGAAPSPGQGRNRRHRRGRRKGGGDKARD